MAVSVWGLVFVRDGRLFKRQQIFITGRVQGVGFRPAVYRLACELGLSGFVYNDTKGVTIEVQGLHERISELLVRLQSDGKPSAAEINSCRAGEIDAIEGETGFVIRTSDYGGTALSQVTADMAVCGDCLREMQEPADFRFGYPFINCTNCGPRYSIVKTIPYDRSATTMSAFEMCLKCAEQYNNVRDRRFHAQPVACGTCGPKVYLTDSMGKVLETVSEKVIVKAAEMLHDGKIVAIKGIGGFHLAVDALNNDAVLRLRQRKRRDHKPFAMMAASVEKIKDYAVVGESAEKLLRNPQSPIVLLPMRPGSAIAPSAAPGVNTYGFMLCYSPLHYLVFEHDIEVLVMTSANLSDEPLICDNDEALTRLGDVADAFVMHNRDIYRQVDDSIVHFIENEPVLLRRARGYVPTPLRMESECPRDILAAGADMKNTFCLVKRDQLICSEHIGDMEDAEVYHHYLDSIAHLKQLFEVAPELVVCDLHPGYFSTRYALSLEGVQPVQVQHHWAHIASVLAENNLRGPVIGLACDGTGYGTDGKIWGCECLVASLEGFERFGHLRYYPLAGGDRAAKEALRSVAGLLSVTCREEFEAGEFTWLLERIERDATKRNILLGQLGKKVNTTDTSSLGRIFDAVAAMLGLGRYNHFEAQLPIALEAAVAAGVEEAYDFELHGNNGGPLQLDLRKMVKQLIADVKASVPRGVISAKFHNGLAAGLFEMAEKAGKTTGLDTAALSGGVFCNRYLTGRLIKLLRKNHFQVLFNRQFPSNDGGISVGQAAIAADIVTRGRRTLKQG
jgi:hydrogenase maturation protein HypF